MRKKFLLTEDRLGLKAGTELYEFWGNTYGIVRDDEALLGTPCTAVTQDPEGKNPFVVIPENLLEEIA